MKISLILGLGLLALGIGLCLTAVRYYKQKINEGTLSNWSRYEYFRLKIFIMGCFILGVAGILKGLFSP